MLLLLCPTFSARHGSSRITYTSAGLRSLCPCRSVSQGFPSWQIKSSRQRATDWKHLSLAMLYGLQFKAEDEDESGFLSRKREMERMAEGSLVKLKKDGKKWRLVAQLQNWWEALGISTPMLQRYTKDTNATLVLWQTRVVCNGSCCNEIPVVDVCIPVKKIFQFFTSLPLYCSPLSGRRYS